MKALDAWLVGGYVRDRLIGRPAYERDWVVLHATPKQLIQQGFHQVGSAFPVFLHPHTKEEYALARSEQKQGSGHKGFIFATQDVSLEQDLQRRDLTINALAQNNDGSLVDPYGGLRDIQGRWLKHISPAFAEDPLRVLRVARFAAQLAPWGFRIAPHTLALMRSITQSGELETLPPERIWKETEKALACEQPSVFFTTLRNCGALAVLFGEIDALFGVPQNPTYHPEIDCGIHTMMVVNAAARALLTPAERFASLVHDLGKATTPAAILPAHHQHEQRGVALVHALCKRLGTPTKFSRLAHICCAEHGNAHRALTLKASTLCDLFTRIDGWRNPNRVASFLKVCCADARGRTGYADSDYPQAVFVWHCLQAARAVPAAVVVAGKTNTDKAHALRKARIAAIDQAKAAFQPHKPPLGPLTRLCLKRPTTA